MFLSLVSLFGSVAEIDGVAEQEKTIICVASLHAQEMTATIGVPFDAKSLIAGRDGKRGEIRCCFTIDEEMNRSAIAGDHMNFDRDRISFARFEIVAVVVAKGDGRGVLDLAEVGVRHSANAHSQR